MIPLGWIHGRAYQRKAARELASGRRAGLWAAAGIGKTACALFALALADIEAPVLIITRAIGRHAWPRDASWALGPNYPVGILWGGAKRNNSGYHSDNTYTDLELLLSENYACVMNYDILGQRMRSLLAVPWKAIIFDEAHSLKGGYAPPQKHRDGSLVRRRWHWAKELAVACQRRCGTVWQLTATPVRDRRRDLWSQLDLVLPGRILSTDQSWRRLKAINKARAGQGKPWLAHRSLYKTTDGFVSFPGPFGASLVYGELEHPESQASCFLRRYCGCIQGAFGLVHDEETMSEELAERLNLYFIRLRRQDVAAELPPVSRDARVIDPVGKVPRHYMGGGIEQALARAAYQKMPAAMDLIGDHVTEGDRVVVVTTRRRLAHETHAAVCTAATKLPPAVRRELEISIVTGEDEVRKRVAILDDFNKGKGPGILVATMDCMSESVDLHFVNAVVCLALPYTPGQIDQFEGRFARLGGVPVIIYYLIADGSIDMKIRDILLPKLSDLRTLRTDTAHAADAARTLLNLHDEEKVIAELRSFLKSVGEFEEE